MNKNLEILEFHKILDMLANLSANDITREKVLAITPNPDLAEARAELEKTNDAFQLSIQFGAPPFHRFQDMRMGLRRAKSGAKLSLKDLLEIATILRQMQSLSDWYDRCSGVESALDDLFSQLAPVPFLLEKLDRSILSEEEIADAASPALAEIRRKIGRSRQKLRDTLDSMMRRQEVQDCLQDNRVTLRDVRNTAARLPVWCMTPPPPVRPFSSNRLLWSMPTTTFACWNCRRQRKSNVSLKNSAPSAAHGRIPLSATLPFVQI